MSWTQDVQAGVKRTICTPLDGHAVGLHADIVTQHFQRMLRLRQLADALHVGEVQLVPRVVTEFCPRCGLQSHARLEGGSPVVVVELAVVQMRTLGNGFDQTVKAAGHSPLGRVHGLPPLVHKRLPDFILAHRLQSPTHLTLRGARLRSRRALLGSGNPNSHSARRDSDHDCAQRTSAVVRNESPCMSCKHALSPERSSALQRCAKSVRPRELPFGNRLGAKRALWGNVPGRPRKLHVLQ